jgi:flagellar motor switch protein FliM
MDSEPSQPNVSASEVEGLLAQAGGGTLTAKTEESAAKKAGAPAAAVQLHVFRQLSSLSAADFRKLKLRQEDFIRSLSARLAGHLRLEVGLKISRLDTLPYRKFAGGLSNPTHLVLLKLEPLNGLCLLDIPPQLGLSIVDRELGGKGVCSENERALSEIEVRILSRVIELTTAEWCHSWSGIQDLRPVFVGYESSASFIQNFPQDTLMLVLGIEMQIGELTRQMHFAFPYPTVEPLIKKLGASAPGAREVTEKRTPAALKWNPALDDINLQVSAELPSLKITAREVASLKSGDVIPLDSEILQHLQLSLAQKPKFLATMGRCGPRWAAKITKVLEA